MAPRRTDARTPDQDHRGHPRRRRRVALAPDPARGPQRRVPRAGRRVRRHARAARGTRRRTTAVRRQRLARAAHPSRDHPDPARRGPQGPRTRPRTSSSTASTTSTPGPSASRRRCSCSAGPTSAPSPESPSTCRCSRRPPPRRSCPWPRSAASRIETTGDAAPTLGSPALLQQLTTNLVHNAIVHNLPRGGTVWVTTSARPDTVVLTVENTGEQLSPQLVATLTEPFQRGAGRTRTAPRGRGPRAGHRRQHHPGPRRHPHPHAAPGRRAVRVGPAAVQRPPETAS